jgi:hypothetical protein
MLDAKTEDNMGVIQARIGRDAEFGTGKRILKALPSCFYAVDLGGGSVLLHHSNAGEAEIACAMDVLSAHGAIL